jgi:uncharacterized protein (TIGR03435 family)
MKHFVIDYTRRNATRISDRWPAFTLLLALFLLPNASVGQKTKQLIFDVATIRKSKTDGFPQIKDDEAGRGIKIRNMPLGTIIYYAFHIVDEGFVLDVPKWADTEQFDIDANVSDEDLDTFHKLNMTQREEMLQPLLAGRFHLKTHFEQKQMSVLVLVVKNGRPKLRAASPLGPPGSTAFEGLRYGLGPGAMRYKSVPMSTFVTSLSGISRHRVVDETGLNGVYDFTLVWDPNQGMSEHDSEGEASRPSVFGALEEQLGLKLLSRKLPQPVLVVDQITPPSEN